MLFRSKYGLPLRVVIVPEGGRSDTDTLEAAYAGDGVMVDSGVFNGLGNQDAKEAIADLAEERGWGRRTVNFKLRDWLVSRQRYWGTPIPMVHCPSCGVVPVPVEELPVLLPEDVSFGEGNPLETNQIGRASCRERV